jgi:hypothetical protein
MRITVAIGLGLALAGGRLQVALFFTIDGDKISEIEAIAEPAHLARLDIAALDS